MTVVNDVSITTRIADALAQRHSQREFVRRLGEAWGALAEDVDGIGEALAAADTALRNVSPTTEVRQRIGNSLELLLRPAGGSPSPVGEMWRRVGEIGRAIEAVSVRVRRESVNLGVVGVTRSGKSTLLRSITGLDQRVVPSSDYNPTTAAPSRIYHDPGPFRAVVNLHDWTSFRDSYLTRLHRSANLGPAPRTLADFENRSYDTIPADVGAQPFVEKLRIASRTLPSYRHLLGSRETLSLTEDELKPYVAYPSDGDDESDRPYHAVRSVDIYCPFPNVSVTRLGLVDMPGEGESGLNVEELFIERMRTEVDLLLLLKRPTERDSFFTNQDESALKSVDAARGGVDLRDAFRIVINPDLVNGLPGFLANALDKISERVRDRGIQIFQADVSTPEAVAQHVLGPALEHLADRLAEMDRAAVGAVLKDVEGLAADLAAFAEDLATRVKGWRAGMPNVETQLARLARGLRDQVSRNLYDLMRDYDKLVSDGTVDQDLGAAITTAADKAREQLETGFGKGRERWIEEFYHAIPGRGLAAGELAFIDARGHVADIFDDIDASLERAVHRLWSEVAGTLHARLTDELVPGPDDGAAALRALRDVALAREAEHLPAAIDDLLELKDDYGSLVLRVTRPILRNISPKPPPQPGAAHAAGLGMAVTGAVADAAVNAVGIPVPVSPVIAAAKSWWDRPQAPAGPTVPTSRSSAADDREAAQFFAGLSQVVLTCIKDLEQALLDEARLTPRALAAAIDRFWDAACVADFTEMDFERICGPIRNHIWPAEFDGNAATVATELAKVADQARALLRDVDSVRSLQAGLRLHAPEPGRN